MVGRSVGPLLRRLIGVRGRCGREIQRITCVLLENGILKLSVDAREPITAIWQGEGLGDKSLNGHS